MITMKTGIVRFLTRFTIHNIDSLLEFDDNNNVEREKYEIVKGLADNYGLLKENEKGEDILMYPKKPVVVEVKYPDGTVKPEIREINA